MHLNQLTKNRFVKNVIILSTGALGAQLINMMAIPIITRLYGPEAYGLMGSFLAISSIVIPIASLTYPIAIVLPQSRNEARDIAKLSLYISFIMFIVSFLFLTIMQDYIVEVLNLHEISVYLLLIPVVILFSGIKQVLEQWLIRSEAFKINAQATLYQSLITNLGTVGIGLILPFAPILIIFSSIKNGVMGFLAFILARKSGISLPMFSKGNIKNYKSLAKKYRDFPLFRAPETLINALSQSLPILMLSSFFGVATVGYYTIGRTVLSIPTQLVGKAVGDVFYPKINEAARNQDNIMVILIKTTSILAIIGLIPFGVIIIYGPYLFSFVFGEEWILAGEYARWMALWTFFSFINQPSVRTLPVLNAQRFHLLFTICMLIGRIAGLTLGYLIFSDDLAAIIIFSIIGAILNLALIFITIYMSKRYIERSSYI